MLQSISTSFIVLSVAVLGSSLASCKPNKPQTNERIEDNSISVNDYGIPKRLAYSYMAVLAKNKLAEKNIDTTQLLTIEHFEENTNLTKCGFFCAMMSSYIDVHQSEDRYTRYNYSCYMTFDSSLRPETYEFRWLND